MFLFILPLIIKSEKSLFFAPGFGTSELYATITIPENFPKCVGTFNHKPINRNPDVASECLDSLIDTVYNKTTGTFSHPEGVIIETDPIQKADHETFLEGINNSYIVPYNWALYFPGTMEVFSTLKSAIEQNYTATNEKVILVGYSLGTNFMRYFTTEYNTKEWVKKYVDGILFLAPGIGGTFTSIIFVATNKVFMVSGPAARHMPSQWAMFPNFPLYKKCIEDGDNFINCEDVYEHMKKAGDTDEVTDAVYESVRNFLSKDMQDPGVRTGFIMNSGLVGTCGAKKVNGTFEEVHCPADGSLETRGAEYACSHWSDVQCYDYKKNDEAYNHGGIGNQPYTRELLLKFVNNQPFPTPSKENWFSGMTMYIIIGAAASVVILIIVISVVCVVKKKKQNVQSVHESLLDKNSQY